MTVETRIRSSSSLFGATEHTSRQGGDSRVAKVPAELERLASELRSNGLETHFVTPIGKRPYLHVRNPQARILAENIVTEAGWYWYSWAERIAQVSEVVSASEKITRMLRTLGSERDSSHMSGKQ
jgi:hypothetical protein